MRTRDFLYLTGTSLIARRMRSFLTATGIAVGIAAVVLLTSIGEGVHQFVLAEFTQFGTTLVGINPAIGFQGADCPRLVLVSKVNSTVLASDGSPSNRRNKPVKTRQMIEVTTITASPGPGLFAVSTPNR